MKKYLEEETEKTNQIDIFIIVTNFFLSIE